MEAKFQKFTPGEYLPFEEPLIEQKQKDFADVLAGKGPQMPTPPAAPYRANRCSRRSPSPAANAGSGSWAAQVRLWTAASS